MSINPHIQSELSPNLQTLEIAGDLDAGRSLGRRGFTTRNPL